MRVSFAVALTIGGSVLLRPALLALGIAQSPGVAVASDIRKYLPAGWTCTLISEQGKMGHPHGLDEPIFRLDFVNRSLAFSLPTGPGRTRLVHPNLRLHFHASAERERVLKTIEAERIYSWAIPVLFADTRDYVVVTSPLWQNYSSPGQGVYTDEANRLIAPLLEALKKYFESRKQTGRPHGAASRPRPNHALHTTPPGGIMKRRG